MQIMTATERDKRSTAAIGIMEHQGGDALLSDGLIGF